VALLPNRTKDSASNRAEKKAAQDDVLVREVDEAVRQGQMEDFGKRYGRPLLALLIIGLLAFGGYLWWQSQQEAAMESDSETLTAALDQLEAGNLDTAGETAAPLAAEGDGAAAASAMLLQAGSAAQAGDTQQAVTVLEQLAQRTDVPEAYRDIARVRAVSLQFDDLPSARIVQSLEDLAQPGEPFFGSAGELVAMAHLDQGNTDRAGALFSQIAKDGSVPESIRSRARQMAGMLGVDAIEDVDAVIEEITGPAAEDTAPQPAQ
jgi:hypothetical protein